MSPQHFEVRLSGWGTLPLSPYSSGRSIQATGIVPDIAVAQGDEAAPVTAIERYSEADLPRHLQAESTGVAPTLAPIKPPPGKKIDDFQLSYAVDLIDGKNVNTIEEKGK